MLMTFPALAACGSGQASTVDGASRRPATSVPHGTPLSGARLERAAVTASDLDGYEVQRALASTRAARRTADPSACAPVVHALGTGSAHAATARVARMISPRKSGPGVSMSLSSHTGEDAVRVIDELRTAAGKCRSFKDVQVDFRYEAVEVRPGPGYGDDSVSLRLTQLAADTGDAGAVKVPCAVVAVRQGTTVAMFSTFDHPNRPGGEGPAAVPDTVVRAQLDKLDRLSR